MNRRQFYFTPSPRFNRKLSGSTLYETAGNDIQIAKAQFLFVFDDRRTGSLYGKRPLVRSPV